MLEEVASVVNFVSNLLRRNNLKADKVTAFAEALTTILCLHYRDHWFPDKPNKGSAYRCVRIANREMDPLIVKAGMCVELSIADLLALLPSELTLWVDPNEVSYRIGEEGSIGILYDSETLAAASEPENSHPTIYQSCNEQMRLTQSASSSEPISWDFLTAFVTS